MTSYDIEQLGKQAAEDFIRRQVPLNSSIVKIASDRALNRHQIGRVVEKANTNVHLHLYNSLPSSEKYPEFETANADQVYEQLHAPSVKTAGVSDYEKDPVVSREFVKTAELKFVETEEEPKTRTQSEVRNDFYKLASVYTRLRETADEKSLHFSVESDKLYELTKQAFLQGTKFGDIYKAATSQDNEIGIIDGLFSRYQQKLGEEMPLRKSEFEKVSEITYTVNSQHPIIQQVRRLTKLSSEYIDLRNKEVEAYQKSEELKKEAGAWKSLMALIGETFKNPRAAILPVVAAGGGGIAIGKSYSKEKQLQGQSPLQNIPERYRK